MGGGASQHQELLTSLKKDGPTRTEALRRIQRFGYDSANLVFMGSKESGLIPILASIVVEQGADRNVAIDIFLNLTCPLNNRAYIGRKAYGLIYTCIQILNNVSLAYADLSAAGSLLWNLGLHLSNAEQCVEYGGIEILTKLAMDAVTKNNMEYLELTLTTLMINSRVPGAALRFAKIPGALECFQGLVDCETLDGLRATVVVANMVGRQEGMCVL